LSVLGWTALIGALVVFHYARPEHDYGLLRYFGADVRTTWIADLRNWYALLVGCALVSIISLIISHGR
jgi:hypothetical protein